MSNEPPPSAQPDGSDPSMEEILASIRRILSEDGAPAASVTPPPPPPEDDVLVLDESMMVQPERQALDVEPEPDPEPMPEPEAEPETPHEEPEAMTPPVAETPPPAIPHSDLVAPEAAAAAASSVGSLMRTLAAGRATQVYAGGPTLEDMVRAELRPLIKEWLDTNLPPMVERLVRAEIERVVGRAVP